MCLQWAHVLYSVVRTWQSNPPISHYNSLCNEFSSVWSIFVYNMNYSWIVEEEILIIWTMLKYAPGNNQYWAMLVKFDAQGNNAWQRSTDNQSNVLTHDCTKPTCIYSYVYVQVLCPGFYYIKIPYTGSWTWKNVKKNIFSNSNLVYP